jgi:hypothetical protein
MKTYKMTIHADRVSEVREWFRSRKGVALWTNLEIGNNRPDMMTPATDKEGRPAILNYTKPHWAMGFKEYLSPDDIQVVTRTDLALPPEWFPICSRCLGTGVRSLVELSTIRGETLEQTLELTKGESWYWGEVDTDTYTFPCNYCRGTGHERKPHKGRIRRHYWGTWISDGSERKAKAMCVKLARYYQLPEKEVEFDWSYAGYGLAEFTFCRCIYSPFTLEG